MRRFIESKFCFNNEFIDGDINNFKSKIEIMCNEIKMINEMLINLNFKKIYHENIEKRIKFVHNIFSILLDSKRYLNFDNLFKDDDKHKNNDKYFFVEQFILNSNEKKRDSRIGKIRIFHFLYFQEGIITIYPLFIDTNHQIIFRFTSKEIFDLILYMAKNDFSDINNILTCIYNKKKNKIPNNVLEICDKFHRYIISSSSVVDKKAKFAIQHCSIKSLEELVSNIKSLLDNKY